MWVYFCWFLFSLTKTKIEGLNHALTQKSLCYGDKSTPQTLVYCHTERPSKQVESRDLWVIIVPLPWNLGNMSHMLGPLCCSLASQMHACTCTQQLSSLKIYAVRTVFLRSPLNVVEGMELSLFRLLLSAVYFLWYFWKVAGRTC